MTLIFGKVSDLTPEQLITAIRLAAQREYERRLHYLAYHDWEKACRRVKTEDNPNPADDEIRPVAEKVYKERIKQESLDERRLATVLLKQEGNSHPTDEQIQWKTEQLHEDYKRKQAEEDWLQTEKSIITSQSVMYPIEWRKSIS